MELKDYFQFLSFASVSSEPKFKKDMGDCVQWLKKTIEDIGLKTQLWKRRPILCFSPPIKRGLTNRHCSFTITTTFSLCDPLELWSSPPFEPKVRDGEVYARGAQDNKGQCFYVLQALKQLSERDGRLPINIKLCIEGEEENGNVGLESILARKKSELKADYLAIVDLGIPDKDTPAITLGVRGICGFD